MGNLGGVLQSSSRPSSFTMTGNGNPIVTSKIHSASITLSNYPCFRLAFLEYFLSGKWVNEFLDSNPNLVSIHRTMTDNPPNKQSPSSWNASASGQPGRMLVELFQAENDVLVKSPRISGGDITKRELDVEWIVHLSYPVTLLSVLLAAAYPIYLQSKEFNFWLERREDEGDLDITMKRRVESETEEFRLNDSGIEDSTDEYDEKSISYRTEVSLSRHSAESVTQRGNRPSPHASIRPHPKQLRFSHRRKSTTYPEKVTRHVDRRRVRIIIQKALNWVHNQAPGPPAILPSEIANNSYSTSTNNSIPPSPSVSKATLEQILSQSKNWTDSLRNFVDDLPVPVIIARARDPKFMSTLATIAKSHETSFSIFYVNRSYESWSRTHGQEVYNRSFYDVVLGRSTILSHSHGDSMSAGTNSSSSPNSKPHNANFISMIYGIAERNYGDGSPDLSSPVDDHFPDTYTTMHLESPRRDNAQEIVHSMLIMKPVHHVVAQPEYHYLVAVQYDLDQPPSVHKGVPQEEASLSHRRSRHHHHHHHSHHPSRSNSGSPSRQRNSNAGTNLLHSNAVGSNPTSTSVSVSTSPRHSLVKPQPTAGNDTLTLNMDNMEPPSLVRDFSAGSMAMMESASNTNGRNINPDNSPNELFHSSNSMTGAENKMPPPSMSIAIPGMDSFHLSVPPSALSSPLACEVSRKTSSTSLFFNGSSSNKFTQQQGSSGSNRSMSNSFSASFGTSGESGRSEQSSSLVSMSSRWFQSAAMILKPESNSGRAVSASSSVSMPASPSVVSTTAAATAAAAPTYPTVVASADSVAVEPGIAAINNHHDDNNHHSSNSNNLYSTAPIASSDTTNCTMNDILVSQPTHNTMNAVANSQSNNNLHNNNNNNNNNNNINNEKYLKLVHTQKIQQFERDLPVLEDILNLLPQLLY